ncbi:IS110 family transposase [Mycoplasmatota bacterium]|nr:IS110 family transposase [Mycoplasmatota bacterium]
MYYVGTDIGKRYHEASIVDHLSNQVSNKSLKFPNSHTGGNKLIEFIRFHTNDSTDVIIGIESTGHYWLALHSFLKNYNYSINVINPIQTDTFRNFNIRKTKNDSIDSVLIAQTVRFGNFKETKLADEKIIALKNLTRFRFELVDTISDYKRKVIALLDQVFPEYEKLFSDMFGVTSKQLLLDLTTPEEFLNIDIKTLTDKLYSLSRGRLGVDKALKIKDFASNSFGIKYAVDSFTFQIRSLVDQINHMEEKLKELEEYISSIYNELDCHLHTIPGIGQILGASILSEIGDINRYNSASQIVAFAGIDPSVIQSGQFTGTKNRMSKRSSPYLRRAIWLGATMSSLHDPLMSKYYNQKRQEGKAHGTAIGACTRKLTHIIYAVLRDNTAYIPVEN